MLEQFGMAKDLGNDDGYDVSFYGEEFGTVSLTSSQVRKDSSDPEYSCSEDDDSSYPNFEDSDYAQSDEEIDLLKKDDKWFEGYVDHSCIDNDPNAEENDESDNGEESPTLTCPNSSSSEDEIVGELRRKKNRMPKGENFRPEIDMANPSFKIGLKFAIVEMFRKAVRIYSINCGRELIFMNNNRNKIRVVCEESCPFVIHASSVSGSTYLQVKTFNPTHVCSKGEQVHQDYGYRPSRAIVYRARAMAVDIVEGSYTCKKGFLDGCWPVVCLDGCHVKGPHLGQVLSAMGVYANNGMFPLAYAYVEIESNSTWLWFLKLLSGDLNIRNNYVFMTNKQKGLIDVVDALFPHAEHRHCLKHLYGNFYLEHRGFASKHQKEVIARATTVPWHAKMRKMLELSKPAHD
ncbi:unnamed protein product [Prunus armeniaca]